MKKKQCSFTLLEMLIVVILVGVLLGFLFSFFTTTLTAKNGMLAAKEKVMHLESLRLRLGQLFEKFSEKKHSSLQSALHPDAVGSALLVHCDQGLNADPAYSGILSSMLFKSRDQRLCLCSWSKDNKPRVDVLVDKVKDLSLTFFAQGKWHANWPKDKTESAAFPQMLKITILLQGDGEKPRDFFFSLPSNHHLTLEKKTL
jgi:type II secretory pathway component PulJ